MKPPINNVSRRSGRYPWGSKPKQVVEVNIPCELCGEMHNEYCIDGHVSQPHWCESCWRKVMSDGCEP